MKRLLLCALMVCSLFFTVGWSKKTEAQLRKVVERNLKAMQEEDINLVLKDMDSEESKEQIKDTLKLIFQLYDLSYKLVSFKVISVEDDTAKVEVVQETKKVKGPNFNDNVTKAVHTLKKRSSGWKFTDSKILSSKAL